MIAGWFLTQNNFNGVQYEQIGPEHQGQRADNFLLKCLKGVPKSHIYRIIRKGEVRVNKRRIKPDYKLQLDDEVRIPPVRMTVVQQDQSFLPKLKKVQDLERRIIFEDEGLLVLNKPSGMAVHGGSGLSFGVIEALRELRPQAKFLELVHRLDKETSGCLLIAKKRSLLKCLHEQLREKTLRKEYLALVQGDWPRAIKEVNAPLEKQHLKSGERIVRVDASGKPSRTLFHILQRFKTMTLVKASPVTGRTHQIRVHCQTSGHSIAGDTKYGSEQTNQWLQESYNFKRLFLHAHTLTFCVPEREKPILVTADIDEEMEDLLTRLEHDHKTER